MHNQDNKLICDQLQSLAAAIPTMEDADLLPAILDSCAILLEQVKNRHAPLGQLDPIQRSELTGAYAVISQQVTRFASDARKELGLDVAPEQDPMGLLADEIERARQLEADRAAAQAQLDATREENARRELALERQSQELTALRNFQSGLERELEACSDEVIARQTAENEALFAAVAEQRAKLKALREEEAAQEAQLDNITAHIAAAETRINEIPQINKLLLEEFDQKQAHLARLEQAKVDCSPEVQLELENRIKTLTPEVEALEDATRKLTVHCQQLEQARTDLDEQNQTLQTTVLKQVQSSMAELRQLLTAHQDTLTEVKRQADSLQQSLIQCETLRRDYAEWFEASRTPLDAMLSQFQTAEHPKLRETLDVTQCDRVRTLCAQVRDGLQQLDQLITACAEAARVDQRNLERRVVAK